MVDDEQQTVFQYQHIIHVYVYMYNYINVCIQYKCIHDIMIVICIYIYICMYIYVDMYMYMYTYNVYTICMDVYIYINTWYTWLILHYIVHGGLLMSLICEER